MARKNYSESGQLSLPIRLDDRATLDNFYLPENSPNILVLDCLQGTAEQSGLYLWGDQGAGVTHLMQGLCHQATDRGMQSIYLPLDEVAQYPAEQVLSGLEAVDILCLDNLESVLLNSNWEEQLFHLFNIAQSSHCRMVFGARAAPLSLEAGLADLRSRLGSLLIFRAERLSDEQACRALIFRAGRRSMDLPIQVAEYLTTRFSRKMSDLFELLDELDRASLAEKRKLTIPFVKSILEA